MSIVGYARVSSTGQSLEIQLDKLSKAGCTKIFHEKVSGVSGQRAKYKECLEYLREGDTLVITKLDRLARSVFELSKISNRFNTENIGLIVLDQNIDTTQPTGKLMFNMLACIAEFENDLRTERQKEGIARAKENNVKFGRPVRITEDIRQKVINARQEGSTISNISKQFDIGVTSIYRILKNEKV